VVVFGVVQTPSITTVQLFVPPLPSVTVLGRAGVIDQVHAAVVGVAASWKPVGIPTTMPALAGPVILRALAVAGCAWAVAVRPSVPSVAAVAAATTSLRVLRALSYPGLVGRAVGTYFGGPRRGNALQLISRGVRLPPYVINLPFNSRLGTGCFDDHRRPAGQWRDDHDLVTLRPWSCAACALRCPIQSAGKLTLNTRALLRRPPRATGPAHSE
jgi:hypothetical protein